MNAAKRHSTEDGCVRNTAAAVAEASQHYCEHAPRRRVIDGARGQGQSAEQGMG